MGSQHFQTRRCVGLGARAKGKGIFRRHGLIALIAERAGDFGPSGPLLREKKEQHLPDND